VPERDEEEQDLRITLMTTQIERLRQEIRMETRKFLVQLLLAFAATLAAGVAIGRFWLFHS
jgi:hypothetical protein